jgi:hypothetical protein
VIAAIALEGEQERATHRMLVENAPGRGTSFVVEAPAP